MAVSRFVSISAIAVYLLACLLCDLLRSMRMAMRMSCIHVVVCLFV